MLPQRLALLTSADPALLRGERAANRRAHVLGPGAARAMCACTITLAIISCRAGSPQVSIHTDDAEVRVAVELALTDEEQRRGLMFRDHLDADHGMLFVFRHARPRSFWMKNTQIPLDIVYLDAAGTIVSIAERTTPYSETPIPSRLPAKYVLEVVGGFCQDHGVHAGQRTDLPAAIDETAADAADRGRVASP